MQKNNKKGALIAVPFVVLIVLVLFYVFIKYNFLFYTAKTYHKAEAEIKGDPFKDNNYYEPNLLYVFLTDSYCCRALKMECLTHYDLIVKKDTHAIDRCWNSFMDNLNCCDLFIHKAKLSVTYGDDSYLFTYKHNCDSEECGYIGYKDSSEYAHTVRWEKDDALSLILEAQVGYYVGKW